MKPLRENSFAFISIIVSIAGVIYALVSLLSPVSQLIIPVGLVIGIILFYLAYKIIIENPRWIDIRLLIIILSSSTLGCVLILVGCLFLNNKICYEPKISTQIVSIYFFPSLMNLGLWLQNRLTKIVADRKKKRIEK